MTLRVRGEQARIDYAVDTPGMPAGTYFLFNAGLNTTTLVFPAQKSFMVLDSSTASGTVAQANEMLKPRFSAVASRRDSLGAGDTILGFPSRKFRVGMGMTMDVGAETMSMSVRTETQVEMHVSEAIAALAPGFRILGRTSRSSTSGFASGLSDLFRGDTAVHRAMTAMTPPSGFITVQASTQRVIIRGDTTTTTTTMRLTSLERGDVPAGELVVPDGFTKTDMASVARQQMQPRPPR
ncbi:MAG TPA: hypothetical protein VE861_04910 [Gemmatimonadaceae bacterium]|nr:hypothetical protein [Gemmatimonadaceae bacterium]